MAVNRHPQTLAEPGITGGILRAWFTKDTSDAAIGTLIGAFQSQGDAAPGSPFTFKFWDGAALMPLLVQDDVFGISAAFESQCRYNLVVMYDSEDSPSNWHSSDDGRTWMRVGEPPPIYSLITNDSNAVISNAGNSLILTPS